MSALDELRQLKEARAGVRETLERLNAETRAEIVRARDDGKTMHEIAAALGVSRQAAYDFLNNSD